MNDVDEQLLRAALDRRADRLNIPAPPVGSLLSGGRARARARRVRFGIGVAAIAVGGAALTQPGLLLSVDPAGPSAPSGPASPTSTAADPRNVEDLREGDPPGLPYVSRHILHWRGTETPLGTGDAFPRVGGGALVTYRMDGESGWSVHLVDEQSGEGVLLTENATGQPVVSIDGRYAAWQASLDGKARVEIWSISDGSPVTTLTFPFAPTCCDNPFLLIGIDGLGRAYGYGVSANTTWVSDVHQGTTKAVQGLRGVPIGVTPDGLVARVDRTSKAESATLLLVGRVEADGSFTDPVEVTGDQAAVSDDGAAMAYVDQDGALRVRDLVSDDEELMRLPEAVEVAGLVWEDTTAVLVEAATIGEHADNAWVRCFADTGRCELATRLDPAAAVARR